MTDQEILDVINETLEEENGLPISMYDKVIDSQIDSFGITVLLLSLEAELDIELPNAEKEDWETLRAIDLVQMIKAAQCL